MTASDDPGSPWCELSESEVAALVPFTLQCSDLDRRTIRHVRETWREMVYRGFFALVVELDRLPDERECALLARAIVAHIDSEIIPRLGAHGRATLH